MIPNPFSNFEVKIPEKYQKTENVPASRFLVYPFFHSYQPLNGANTFQNNFTKLDK